VSGERDALAWLDARNEAKRNDYAAFLAGKRAIHPAVGIEVPETAVNSVLFPFQRDLVRWSLRKGRCALFADTGMGKTRMQIEWARLTGQRTLILAPLSVARQTVAEGARIGVDVAYARSAADAPASGITITNYEMLHAFEDAEFGAVVLDESSILKSTAGVYRNMLVDRFASTPYRLACTATPAPNDIAEITNHAAFLGIMPRRDVLATFFKHDADDARASGWRLKAHAREAFWRWLASWGLLLKRPSDLGYPDEGYNLPELTITPQIVGGEVVLPGRMFADKLKGVSDRATVRKQTATARVARAVELIQADRQPWIAWCGLNGESTAISQALGDEAIEVTGSMSPDEKAQRIEWFIEGRYRVLVTKVEIAGFGMNFQHCARMAFVGLSDSYEQYYQAIRRCWRFGQPRPVEAHVVLSETERAIFDNVLRKEHEAEEMARELVKHVAAYERAEIEGRALGDFNYTDQTEMYLPEWLRTEGAA
jgi:superfamily II DNA or RNA helicase